MSSLYNFETKLLKPEETYSRAAYVHAKYVSDGKRHVIQKTCRRASNHKWEKGSGEVRQPIMFTEGGSLGSAFWYTRK